MPTLIAWMTGRACVVEGKRQRWRRYWLFHVTSRRLGITKLGGVWYWPFGITFKALIRGRRFSYER